LITVLYSIEFRFPVTRYFITGNDNKFAEAKAIFPDLERLDIDLPEIQSNDPCEIIEAKLKEACKHHNGEFIVEDTSLFVECMNGLPGPLVKWFLQAVGAEGIYTMAKHKGKCDAEARAVIGYAKEGTIQYFTGSIRGELVPPRGKSFGWDPIFQPKGHTKTFGEMSTEEKNKISHRKLALQQLKEAL